MATIAQLTDLRRRISEPDETTYTDAYLSTRIDAEPDLDALAVLIWEEKASTYAELVDISEAGSSRKNGQLYKNALDMAAYYASKSDSAADAASELPGTTPIFRAV